MLHYLSKPALVQPKLLMGFSGWMDGGDVSTGTIEYFVRQTNAERFAEIEPDAFYIYNFPGSMELSALFRPHCRIEEGRLHEFEEPKNHFWAAPEQRLILFRGKEPNLQWQRYADQILDLAAALGVSELYFIGSVAGMAPHTREPRFYSSSINDDYAEIIEAHGLRPSNYEGPASFVTFLMAQAKASGLRMATLVAEIPAYIQSRNAKCIHSAARKLGDILDLDLDFAELAEESRQFEQELHAAAMGQKDLAEQVRKMEAAYDRERIDADDEDLRGWFERQGFRLDEGR